MNLTGWPAGMRVIVRRERPHPGAQLRLTDPDGHRYTAFTTNTRPGGPGRQPADLEEAGFSFIVGSKGPLPGRALLPDDQVRARRPARVSPAPRQHRGSSHRRVRRPRDLPGSTSTHRTVHQGDRKDAPAATKRDDHPRPPADHRRPAHPRPAPAQQILDDLAQGGH